MTRRTGARVAVAASVLLGGWLALRGMQPRLLLLELGWTDHDDSRRREQITAKLVTCGPRAVPAMIGALRHSNVGAYSVLPIMEALRRMGEPARRALGEAVDREREPIAQINLIEVMQLVFRDCSRAHLWAVRVVRGEYVAPPDEFYRYLWAQYGPDVPPVVGPDGRVSPTFASWYARMSRRGKLPSCPEMEAAAR